MLVGALRLTIIFQKGRFHRNYRWVSKVGPVAYECVNAFLWVILHKHFDLVSSDGVEHIKVRSPQEKREGYWPETLLGIGYRKLFLSPVQGRT